MTEVGLNEKSLFFLPFKIIFNLIFLKLNLTISIFILRNFLKAVQNSKKGNTNKKVLNLRRNLIKFLTLKLAFTKK